MRFKTASKILSDRIKDRPDLREDVQQERLNIECARLIYAARKQAGLSQAALAALIGTSQAAIARLENSDYNGRTLQMLSRIAIALGRELRFEFSQVETQEPESCYDNVQSEVHI